MNVTHPAGRQPGPPPGSTYWLIAKVENGRIEALTVDGGGGEALPVFSHEEEAELFLCLGEIGDGWRVRESSAGEVISLLFGPCAGVGSVTLDPLPATVARAMIKLLSLSRERFLDRLMGTEGEVVIPEGAR